MSLLMSHHEINMKMIKQASKEMPVLLTLLEYCASAHPSHRKIPIGFDAMSALLSLFKVISFTQSTDMKILED